MNKFKDKKLLVLGTSVGSVEIIEYAKSEGAYVYVADYLPKEKSVAKMYADEDVLISTTDIDALVDFGKSVGIDGIFCGVSEVNLLSVNAVAERLGLPCYFTKEQWEISENKANFKTCCKTYGVPVAKDYEFLGIPNKEDAESICYPVIVKPVDRSAGVGIHICYNTEEFLAAYEDAYECSFSHKVIVETFLEGIEFNVAYTAIDGEIRLSSMGDKYLCKEQVGLMPLPQTYIFPSQYLDKYKKEVNEPVIKMFKELGVKNGTFFVQGITNGEEMVLIEAGLRMEGTAMFKFISQVNNINIMELMTEYALTGKMSADINNEDPLMNGRVGCLFSLLNGGGKIASIDGVELFEDNENIFEIIHRHKIGDIVKKDGTLRQIQTRFYMLGKSREEIKNLIEEIQKRVVVKDEGGKNMLLRNFDTARIINKGVF